MKKIGLSVILLSGLLFGARVFPIYNKLVLKECSSCHFAYQPGLLPKHSWKKIMGNLANHFGVDASLNKKDRGIISRYYIKHASDNSMQYLSRLITKHTRVNEIRITTGAVFRSAHREVRRSSFNRKSVGGAGNCIACHRTANRGIYSEE